MIIDLNINSVARGLSLLTFQFKSTNASASFFEALHFDQIEDLEMRLTDIIKQLQDYRMKHNHG